jgi:hypothetical protein
METINDQSTCYLTATFKDRDGNVAIPSAVTYQVRRPGVAIVRAVTAVSPASTVTITLTPADNTLSAGHQGEYREVTVVATYGANDKVSDHMLYQVAAVGI